jgi:hypothetical protein
MRIRFRTCGNRKSQTFLLPLPTRDSQFARVSSCGISFRLVDRAAVGATLAADVANPTCRQEVRIAGAAEPLQRVKVAIVKRLAMFAIRIVATDGVGEGDEVLFGHHGYWSFLLREARLKTVAARADA